MNNGIYWRKSSYGRDYSITKVESIIYKYKIREKLNMHYTSQQNDWLVQPFRQPASVQETDNQIIS